MGLMDKVPASAAFARIQSQAGSLIWHARDIETLTVYEWDEKGVQQNAFGDQQVSIPAGAARIELQLYNFPTCQLRKIYFPKGTRTPWHPNLDDTLFYSIDARQVEFVGTQSFHARPGDVTLHPVGVDHHSETLTAGWRLEFAFEAQPGKCGRDLIALPGDNMIRHDVVEWVEAGVCRRIVGNSEQSGCQFRARMFHFPIYTLHEQYFSAGSILPPHRNASEKLIYVLQGRLRITTDTLTDELTVGAMARLPAGKSFAREALSDCVVIELTGHVAPRAYPRHD